MTLPAQEAAEARRAQVLMNKLEASKQVRGSVVEPLLAKPGAPKGLRVLQYQDSLPQGTRIEPAFEVKGRKTAPIITKNPSWLFMVDEAPGAHFAHPVKLVVVDAKTREQQVVETEWWPKVDNRPVFESVSARLNPASIVYSKPGLAYKKAQALTRLGDPANISFSDTLCNNWAVIVCGYDDLSDTFHVDANAIYSVLKSLGVDDSRIFYTSPHAGHPGVDRPTTVANVQWAIGQVASRARTTDKVLFFYSSHGSVDGLVCGGSSIPASSLAGWLNAIRGKEMAVIVEACHSGSLIGKYRDGRYIASEDDLTGHGETNRIVFTSASTDTSSYGDVDGSDDPNGASDLGSESIYGFMMAYSVASADRNHDGRVSFAEAYQYAWDNDVTRIRGDNVPQLKEGGLNKDAVFVQCQYSRLAERRAGSRGRAAPAFAVSWGCGNRLIPAALPSRPDRSP